MKTKLDLAHEYAMRDLGTNELHKNLAARAWDYADAMYAKMEKCEDKSRPEILFDKHECKFVYGRVCPCGNVKDETK